MKTISLKEEAYRIIKEKIVNQTLAPGTPLIETDLAEELGMSRTPIRDAIKQLAIEGLVVSYSSRSTFVSPINPHDVEDLFTIRICLEKLALELSFDKINIDEVDALISIYQEFIGNYSNDKAYQFDQEFHSLWVKHSGNKRLITIISLVNEQLERYRKFSYTVQNRSIKSIEEHIQILEAIKERDLAAAEKALTEHLNNAKLNIIYDGSNFPH